MMKQFTTIMAFFLLGTVLSCTDETVKDGDHSVCLPASYIVEYCSSGKPLSLIRFLEPTELATKYPDQFSDSTFYYAAVYDLPESVQKKDTVFFMKFYFNSEDEKYRATYCPTVFMPVKIIGCDAVTDKSCQSLLSKL